MPTSRPSNPDKRYGYRVHRPSDPANGHRGNPGRLLLDPYTKAIDGRFDWDPAVFPYRLGPDSLNEDGSSAFLLKCVVRQPHFDWAGDRRLQPPWHETVIYETHVNGLTARHPDVPEELRGTYAGMAQPAVIDDLKQLGITAVERMPVHQFVPDKHLVERDGESHNRSWKCGAEGPTDDARILELGNRQKRNFLATLLLSQGVPIILGGDEVGRTQRGNNNPDCQDNEISWYAWEDADEELLEFCRRLIHYCKNHPVFSRRGWFQGRAIYGTEAKDIAWFTMDGKQMFEADWGQGFAKTFGVFLNGATIPNPHPRGEPTTDDTFYLLVNTHFEPLRFRLPHGEWGARWESVRDAATGWDLGKAQYDPADEIALEGRSLRVLRAINEE